MGQLVNDAKELVMRLKEREKNVDQVVLQSNALAKKVDAIQQVCKIKILLFKNGFQNHKVAILDFFLAGLKKLKFINMPILLSLKMS